MKIEEIRSRLREGPRAPYRRCLALSHVDEHPAEVVCTREGGFQWFSCREHVPEGVSSEPIFEWFERRGLLDY